jgi:multiple sugar transport system ATP-binding protein
MAMLMHPNFHQKFTQVPYNMGMKSQQALKIDSVVKSYGDVRVLDSVSLEVHPGEFISLVGPSGCGKSTLLRIIAGLEAQDVGSVSIGNSSVDELMPKERDVAMVFQNYALYPHMTVQQNISLPLEMSQLSWMQRLFFVGNFFSKTKLIKDTIANDVLEICKSLGLENLLKRKPAQLSGGQRQRVALARAMIRNPAVFLMDEPLSNLDAKLRIHLRNELVELHKRLKATFVYVTHDQSEAMTMSDRIAVMDSGKILQIGTPNELYTSPDSLKVAQFIGTPQINLFELTDAKDGSHFWGSATSPLNLNKKSTAALALRPEHLIVEAHRLPTCDVQSSAVISRLEDHGSEILLHLAIDGYANELFVTRIPNLSHQDGFRPGERINVGFKLDTALFFDAQGRRSV